MEDDEFFKELNEATNYMAEKEVINNKDKELKENKNQSTTGEDSKPVNDNNMKALLDMFNIKPEDFNMDESNPEYIEFLEAMKNFDKMASNPSTENKTQTDKGENPFTLNENDMFNMKDIENIFSSLSQLENHKENTAPNQTPDAKVNDLMSNLLTTLIDIGLLKEPLSDLRASAEKHLTENKDKLDDTKKANYANMIDNISIILKEMEKSNPDKSLIIEVFVKLNDINDLDGSLFTNLSPELSGLLKNN